MPRCRSSVVGRALACGAIATAFFVGAAAFALTTTEAVASTQDAAVRGTHVEGPHVLLGEDGVTVLWSSGAERHEQRFERAATIDVPAWKGAPALEDLSLAEPRVGPSVFDAPDRVLAVGDVHGRYEPFVAVLRHAGVIDEANRWTYGRGHLVCCGDLTDRGPEVARSLWLLHRLEREAAAAGGAVHVLLGNHELMVVQGDLRYLHPDHVGVAEVLGVPYPDLYGRASVLGRWLRTKHSIIRIGDLAYAHGGVGPAVLQLAAERGFDHDDVNRLVRTHLDDDRATRATNPVASLLLGAAGPLWHRGYFLDDPQYDPATDAEIDAVLAWLDAKAIVVGHTQFDRVGTHRDGRVIATDVHLVRTPEAVLIERGVPRRVTTTGEPTSLQPLEID